MATTLLLSCSMLLGGRRDGLLGFTSGTIVCYDDEVHFSQIRETGEGQLDLPRTGSTRQEGSWRKSQLQTAS